MKRWEYIVIDHSEGVTKNAVNLSSLLDSYGAIGWELVSTIPRPSPFFAMRLFFKRELDAAKT